MKNSDGYDVQDHLFFSSLLHQLVDSTYGWFMGLAAKLTANQLYVHYQCPIVPFHLGIYVSEI